MESRRLLSTVVWDGGLSGNGTDFSQPANWVGDVAPTAADNAVINSAGATIVIGQSTTVGTLTSSRAMSFTGGTMQFGSATFGAPVNVSGTTLKGGTYSTLAGGSITLAGGTLDGITIASDITSASGSTAIAHGLTFQNGAKLTKSGGGTFDLFSGNQTFSGNGQVVLAHGGSIMYLGISAPMTLTFAPGITLRGYGDIIQGNACTILNQGTIQADAAGNSLVINVPLVNSGTLKTTNGGTLTPNSTWSNTGTVSVDNGTLSLGGTFTGTSATTGFSRNGGIVNITGTLNGGLALNSNTGSWNLVGGNLNGGTFSASGGAELVPSSGTLTALTIASDITSAAGSVRIAGGLTFQNGAKLTKSGTNGTFDLVSGNQTFSGNGQVVLAHSGSVLNMGVGTPMSLTLAPGVTLRGYGDVVQANAGSILNGGTIQADSSGNGLAFYVPLVNSGTLKATGNAALILNSTWGNSGTISVDNSTLNLGGTFTGASATTGFSRNGGTVNITGTLNGGLALNAITGSWNLAGGTLNGGTFSTADGAQLVPSSGTLTALTLASDLTSDTGSLRIAGGLTFQNGARLTKSGTNGTFDLVSGNQTFSGNGQVVLAHSGSVMNLGVGTPMSLTLASGVTLRGYGDVVQANAGSILNGGTIQADSSGNGLAFTMPIVNSGTGLLFATAGGTLIANTSVALNGQSFLQSSLDGALQFAGGLTGDSSSGGVWNLQGSTTFSGGTAAVPRLLEAMSQDAGATATGFAKNAVFGLLTLAAGAYVKLTDASDNAEGAGAEALYGKQLIVPAGATLDLNGLHIYVRAQQINGSVINGTVTPIADGGRLTLADWEPGKIAAVNAVDEWSFFGRGGTNVTVQANPGTSGSPVPVAPQLQWVSVQLLDGSNHVLATATNRVADALTSLANVVLPVDGIYKIRINAPAAHAGSTGAYVVTVYDVTPHTRSLTLNQTAAGSIATPLATDVWTFAASAGQQLQLHPSSASSKNIAYTLTGPGGAIFTDITADSTLQTLATSGQYTLTAHGIGNSTGNYAFVLKQTSQTDVALGTSVSGTLSGSGEARLFRIHVPSTQILTLQFDDATPGNSDELYASFGAPPTRADFDYRSTKPGNSQTLTILSATAGDWYVLVYSASAASGTAFTLGTKGATVQITDVTPGHAGNSAPATLTVTGGGFVAGTTVALVAGNGTTYAPTAFTIDSFAQITATFPANLPPGMYSLRATNAGGMNTRAAAFKVVAGGSAHLTTDLVLPTALGRHQTATLYLKYANTGSIAMPAPLLTVSNPNNDRPLMTLDQSKLVSGFWTSAIPDGFSTTISVLASGATPGVLQPGESMTVPIYYAGLQQPWDFSHTTVPLSVGVATADSTVPLDLNAMAADLRPGGIGAAAWGAIFTTLVAKVGNTYGGYVRLLDDNARYLGTLGEYETDVTALWGLSVAATDGLNPLGTLASSVDASIAAPGLTPDVERSYGETISSRYIMGLFGYGWSVPWQESLDVEADGTVVITTGNGSQQSFQPDSRHAGVYFGEAEHRDTLTAGPSGTFILRAYSGEVSSYRSDGKLSYVQDLNGNRISHTYDASGKLVALTHSSGQSLVLTYNAAGLVATIQDSAGRLTTYAYDSSNQYLLSCTNAQGATSYTYNTTGNAASLHALTSVQNADGTHVFYGYNAAGQLASVSRDGNRRKLLFTYDDAGEVTTTDPTGAATSTYFDQDDLVRKTRDALGAITTFEYDDATEQLQRITDATGQTVTYAYDAAGNVISTADAVGHRNRFAYGANNRLMSLTDAAGNQTAYAYDAAGDLLSTTYANGASERSTFDPLGNALSFVSRNGNAITFARNAAGQITTETLPDGSLLTFGYDGHGNLHTATDNTGTVTLTYNAADQLTAVSYPNGQSITFTLDAAGRRLSMVDPSGYTIKYTYDAIGELSSLTDVNNVPIVSYTYDDAGQLSRKDNANGAHTTYAYDAAGNLRTIINSDLNGTTNGRFDYTYDLLGRRTSMTSLDGSWTYTYDGIGELTHAAFAASNAAIPNQDLLYRYDALGNRTSTVLNGVTTAYTANNLNQYTSVGGVNYSYDLDGNLTYDGTNAYVYDALDRLVSVSNASGVTTYTYDALGNRSSASSGAGLTRFLTDPTDLGNVIGEYDGAGNLLARNVFGLGLTSRTTGGSSYFYDFDASGSVVGMSNSAGNYANAYRYLPFGEAQTISGTVTNPFQFAGLTAVRSEIAGLVWMRARTYVVASGRFTAPDPLRLGGGQANLYTYAANDPLTRGDPSGLCITDMEKAAKDKKFEAQIAADQKEIQSIQDGLVAAIQSYQYLEQHNNVSYAVEIERTKERAAKQIADVAKKIAAETKAEKAYDDYAKAHRCVPKTPTPTPPPPPAPPGPGPTIPNAMDPNDKIGPGGFGSANFVGVNAQLPYRIDFENDAAATAPAQVVTVVDHLSANLDWATFAFTSFGFGDNTIDVPSDAGHFATSTRMTFNGKTFSVAIEGGIDLATGTITVVFQSLDPTTSLPPDVLTGFLPPEDGTGRGKGYFSYTVTPKSGLATGTQIRNTATIVFDQNTSIATDQVSETDPTLGTDPTKQAMITIDAGTPSSTVAALPAITHGDSFTVSWAGTDDVGGSGVGRYDVYVSIDGAAYLPWLSGTTLNSSTYVGEAGHTYGFYSIATDNVGNAEAEPASADAQTQTVAAGPRVTAESFNYQKSPYTLSITFSQDVAASLSLAAIRMVNVTTGTPLAPTSYSYDAASKTVTFTLPAAMADGNYQVRLLSSVLKNVSGKPLDGLGDGSTADFFFNIYLLAGDFNRDRQVNFSDLLILSKQYNQAGADLQADSNGDGIVDFSDLLALSRNYGRSLPPPPSSVAVEIDAASYANTSDGRLLFVFSADVSSTLNLASLSVMDRKTGTAFAATSLLYDHASNTASFAFNGTLPDGNYTAVLSSTVADAQGHPLDGIGNGLPGSDFSFAFTALRGDLNGDGSVNFSDLLIVAKGYNKPGTYSDGDLTGDGAVDFSDLLILAKSYGKSAGSANFVSKVSAGDLLDLIGQPSTQPSQPVAVTRKRT